MKKSRSPKPLALLPGALLLVLLLSACNGSTGDPTGPHFGGTQTYVGVQEVDASGTPLGTIDVNEATSVIAGISRATREGASRNIVAADMTVGFRFASTGGFLELQIINYRERMDKGVPITLVEEFDPAVDPDLANAGSTPKIRIRYFPTQEYTASGTSWPARPTTPQPSWVRVDDVTPTTLFGAFDANVEDGTGRIYHVFGSDDAGNALAFEASMSTEIGQALDPVGVLETTNPGAGTGPNGGCLIAFDAHDSVDPNGVIVQYGLDLDNDFVPDPTIIGPGGPEPGLRAWNSSDVTQNVIQAEVPNPSNLLQTRLWVLDEEGRSTFSPNAVVNCP